MKLSWLKKLKLDRVDLVPAGANPEADIVFFKAATKNEGGTMYPASDYAYVPDPQTPSTWKLRLTSTPGGKPDAKIVGAAIAALGAGFRGQKVQIPSADLSAVKRKVLSAWVQANPDKSRSQAPEVLKMTDEVTQNSEEVEETEATEEESVTENNEVAEDEATTNESEETTESAEELEKAKTEQVNLRKELDETNAKLARVLKEQRRQEFVVKAEKYENLGSVDKIGELLEDADEHLCDSSKKTLQEFMDSASKQVEQGALFDRLSKDSAEPKSWEQKLDQAARDRVAKGDFDTVEQAKVEIMDKDKELQKEYLESKRS